MRHAIVRFISALVISPRLVGSLAAQGVAAVAPLPVAARYEGGFDRKEIPGDFLEIDVTRGTLQVQGAATDRVNWHLGLAPDITMPGGRTKPGSGGLYANALVHGNALFTRGKDMYYQLVAGIAEPDSTTVTHGEMAVVIPRDLKFLRINVYGTGKVIVDGYDGELSVTVDSGSIAGKNLTGPIQMEARNGGIDLDLTNATPNSRPVPINLLSHNGSIGILFGADPSVIMDLNTNCGQIAYKFIPTNGKPGPKVGVRDNGTDLDCSLRPASLPPLPGTKSLRYHNSVQLGTGVLTIQGMALQGDIILSKKSDQ